MIGGYAVHWAMTDAKRLLIVPVRYDSSSDVAGHGTGVRFQTLLSARSFIYSRSPDFGTCTGVLVLMDATQQCPARDDAHRRLRQSDIALGFAGDGGRHPLLHAHQRRTYRREDPAATESWGADGGGARRR